jgi:outer membrane biosynthesis protein TonB
MADKSTRQQQQAKVLRIGIVQGGKVVHERLIKPGQSVTIGESPKNTFVFSAPGLPKRFTIFQMKGGHYQMAFTPEMQGKVALEAGIKNLAQMAAAGSNAPLEFALTAKSRGKIVVGDVTVLFQFVAAPPESARKISRQDFRPKLLDEDDPVFLGFLALWTAVAAVLMIYVYNTEPVESVSMDEIPDRFVTVMQPAEEAPPPPEDTEPSVDPDAQGEQVDKKEKAEDKAEPKEVKEPETKEEKVAAAERKEEKRAEALQKSQLLQALIGTRGENNSGQTVSDVFADGDANLKDLGEALQGVDGASAATEDDVAMRDQKDAGGRGDATIGEVGRGGGGEASVQTVKAAAPKKASAGVGTVEAASGEGADAIRSTVKRYSPRVKQCYEQRLKEVPSLGGRVAVDVSINAGRVTSVTIAENTTGDSKLESCITRSIKSWRFDSSVSDDVYLPFSLNAS